jgi:hypothetical protein
MLPQREFPRFGAHQFLKFVGGNQFDSQIKANLAAYVLAQTHVVNLR